MKKMFHTIKVVLLIAGISVFTVFTLLLLSVLPDDKNPVLIVFILIFLTLDICCIFALIKDRKSRKTKVTFEEKNKNALSTAYNYLSNAAFSPKSDENISNNATTPQNITKPVSQQFESKTQQNTVSSQNFFAMQLANEIRIMNESYELASKTLNLDTFKMRYDLYLEKANLILSRTNNPQTIQRCESLIADKDRLKKRLLVDIVNDALNNAKKLKTPSEIVSSLEFTCNEVENATFLHDLPEYNEIISILTPVISAAKNTTSSTTYAQPQKSSTYSSFNPDYNKSVGEISKAARAHSESMRKLHKSEFSDFDPFNLDKSIVDDTQLTSVEKSFLKYMDGNNVLNPYIPGYWTYEYNINYKKLLTIFLVNDYLKISSDTETLKFLTVEELKDILRKNNMKVSGKKNELISRIKENIDSSVLETTIPKESRKYILTEKGKNITDSVKESATKDIELEDKCIQLILISEFNEAYREICKNEFNKNISIDVEYLNRKYEAGLTEKQLNCFETLMSNQQIEFPDEISYKDYSITKACVILGYLFGLATNKIYLLLCRVTNKEYNNKSEIIPFLQRILFDIHDDVQEIEIFSETSVADEIIKFKQLLDAGAITQEEFDAQKQKLLNL